MYPYANGQPMSKADRKAAKRLAAAADKAALAAEVAAQKKTAKAEKTAANKQNEQAKRAVEAVRTRSPLAHPAPGASTLVWVQHGWAEVSANVCVLPRQ